MLSRHAAFAGFLILLAVFTGCSSRPLEENWGTSYDLTKEAQVLNPDAGQSAEPLTGLDGVAASNEMKKYRESFTKEQKAGQQQRGIFLGTAGASGT